MSEDSRSQGSGCSAGRRSGHDRSDRRGLLCRPLRSRHGDSPGATAADGRLRAGLRAANSIPRYEGGSRHELSRTKRPPSFSGPPRTTARGPFARSKSRLNFTMFFSRSCCATNNGCSVPRPLRSLQTRPAISRSPMTPCRRSGIRRPRPSRSLAWRCNRIFTRPLHSHPGMIPL